MTSNKGEHECFPLKFGKELVNRIMLTSLLYAICYALLYKSGRRIAYCSAHPNPKSSPALDRFLGFNAVVRKFLKKK